MASETTHEIEYNNVVLNVTGFYEPEEKEVTYDADMAGYPGAPAEFDSHMISCGCQNIMSILHYDTIGEIETLILNKYYEHDY
jgi:hypothetical protein|tara:strand:- start:298 stop:546 length:249 start_codon:yes stop_codon:yes gene_type:complete